MVEFENLYMNPITEEEALLWPKCLFILYLLSKSLIEYAYSLYGYNKNLRKRESRSQAATERIQLEKIEEGSDEEEVLKTPTFDK
jgi:hypothetical protein